jgi:hypothetical protein
MSGKKLSKLKPRIPMWFIYNGMAYSIDPKGSLEEQILKKIDTTGLEAPVVNSPWIMLANAKKLILGGVEFEELHEGKTPEMKYEWWVAPEKCWNYETIKWEGCASSKVKSKT